jgi:hypothetical protein
MSVVQSVFLISVASLSIGAHSLEAMQSNDQKTEQKWLAQEPECPPLSTNVHSFKTMMDDDNTEQAKQRWLSDQERYNPDEQKLMRLDAQERGRKEDMLLFEKTLDHPHFKQLLDTAGTFACSEDNSPCACDCTSMLLACLAMIHNYNWLEIPQTTQLVLITQMSKFETIARNAGIALPQ